jgi:hypothetical protein
LLYIIFLKRKLEIYMEKFIDEHKKDLKKLLRMGKAGKI